MRLFPKLLGVLLAVCMLLPMLVACDVDDLLKENEELLETSQKVDTDSPDTEEIKKPNDNTQTQNQTGGNQTGGNQTGGNQTGGNQNGDESITPEDPFGEEITPPLDFGGQEVYILSRSEHRYQREFGCLQARQDSVDERIYLRNAKVEDDLNVKLRVDNSAATSEAMWGNQRKDGELYSHIMIRYNAGAVGADIIGAYALDSTAGALRGMYVNFASDNMPCLKLGEEYWNQSYVKAASLHGQLYYLVGDMNLGVYDKSFVLYVNHNLLGTLDQSKYTVDKLQDTVLKGNWTQEMMETMIRDFGYIDTDFSGTKTNGDTYGLVAIKNGEQYDGFFASFGQSITKKNAQGDLEFVIENNVLSIQTALDAMCDLWKLPGSYAPQGVGPSFEIFYANRALFFTEILFRSDTNLAKLSGQQAFTYSVLPLPKLNTAQATYHTTPQESYTVMSVMNCHSKERLTMISAVLENMASESYETVRPYYIEKMARARYADSSNSVRILELIMDSVTFDAGNIFAQQFKSPIHEIWRNTAANGSITVADKWNAIKSNWNMYISDLNMWYTAYAS